MQSSLQPLFQITCHSAHMILNLYYGVLTLTQHSTLTRKRSTPAAHAKYYLVTLGELRRVRRRFLPGCEIIHEGQPKASAFVLAKGWTFSYKMMANGGRQIMGFQLPGDFLGLRGAIFGSADHSIEAATHIEASEILASDVLAGFHNAPHLASAVLWTIARNEAMVLEHLVSIGRRSAEERMAHLLLELHERLMLLGLGDKTGFACPLTQVHLADALGLSAVHVNRVLRHLREAGLVTFQKGRVVFDNIDRMQNMAGFDAAYLHQDGAL